MDAMKSQQGRWTNEQWAAITTHDRDILVAAAAGSGKTAVLVERMIQRISKSQTPIDIDQMLVVTFTNAAAAEMRQRISVRLEKELSEFPQSDHLHKQLALLNHASISTLHSFCLNVVKKFYYLIGIDPDFRIADTGEVLLLKEEVLEEVLEKAFAERPTEDFYAMLDAYSGDRGDAELQTLILRLYDFAMSHPTPDIWLQAIADSYQVDDVTSLDDLPWASDFLADIRLQLSGIRELLGSALAFARHPAGPAVYIETLLSDMQMLDGLVNASTDSWDTLYAQMQSVTFDRMKSCKKDSCDPEIQQQVKDLRDQVKAAIKKMRETIFSRSSQAYLQDISHMAPIVRELVTTVIEFARAYSLEKSRRKLVDFTDLEHYCLMILRDREVDIPSEARQYYQAKFKEVLVDEYQDTNLVQESILQLIASPENIQFVVGDVKQSIYRFRLAEPELFLDKYKRYVTDDSTRQGVPQMAIDLSKNFRSRREVIDGTNYLFAQIMDQTVGEIAYDEKAALVYGAQPDSTHDPKDDSEHALKHSSEHGCKQDSPVKVLLVDRESDSASELAGEQANELNDLEKPASGGAESAEDGEEAIEDLDAAQLEARVMAKEIRELIRANRGDIQYRDIVILLRATNQWAHTIIEEFKQAGIPAHAELSTGYFTAVEVSVMMSLLQVIDNPYQDIPLAAVLRSPIVGLSGEQLAQIRLCEQGGSYYDAVKEFIECGLACDFYGVVREFFLLLQTWRSAARQGALSDLIWKIYRDTGYFDYVGGMESGRQRQANLQALYDRAVSYENSSFRGLFRFLKFMERMQESGGDLGTARALGEQEDVVRVMTIHKSKGLEFPVVFVAGLGRQFNFQDIRGKYLIHKKLGFGTALIDTQQRLTYPLLSQLAIRQRVKMEQLAEEMRVLYVALTRAKGRLFLVGTAKSLGKSLAGWSKAIHTNQRVLPDYARANARCYLDWIMPALLRHRDASKLYTQLIDNEWYTHPSRWELCVCNAADLWQSGETIQQQNQQIADRIRGGKSVDCESAFRDQVYYHLEWVYPHKRAAEHLAKQSVSDVKRYRQPADHFAKPLIRRPVFMQKEHMTAAERGTVIHMIMQHIDLTGEITVDTLQRTVEMLVDKQFITQEQAEAVKITDVVNFFATDIGKRLLRADDIQREIPFSLAIPASDLYDDWENDDEQVLVQGIIDCVFEDQQGLVMLDYKSDRIHGIAESDLTERYRLQMDLYSRAIQMIWGKRISERYLYFFDNCRFLQV